jgi:hypothetical protein
MKALDRKRNHSRKLAKSHCLRALIFSGNSDAKNDIAIDCYQNENDLNIA